MKVRMRDQISGTRNGEPWPPPGGEVDLPEQEAVKLCANGLAVPVAVKDDVEKAVVADDDVEYRSDPADELPAPPKAGPGSGKDAWAEYAEARGVDVEGLTRDEIIAAVDGE
jgi:hypothetical protein